MRKGISRRNVLAMASAFWARHFADGRCAAAPGANYELAVFAADVTPPLGGPLFNGVAAREIVDPLFTRGFVLLGADQPLVLAALDWCEIRNESYERWRTVLAEAAATSPRRVLVTCLHQHDAPYTDRVAQRLLEEHRADGTLCDADFEDRMIGRVADAIRQALKSPRKISHLGLGQAKVEKVASNRRYVRPDGSVSFGRTSATRDPAIRAMPEGTIDPWLKAISFWDGGQPVAVLNCYSTHPMSYYGKGEVSADFVGMARARRQSDDPSVFQIYAAGCSGDTMAGKYNDGDPKNRPVLADRLYQGILGAWKATETQPLGQIGFRSAPMRLAPRTSPGFTLKELGRKLADASASFRERSQAALGLSWRQRSDASHAIDVPAIDFGPAQLVLLPAEAFVQYQLWAQQMRPDSFVMVMGYGECAPGYIPTAEAVAEGYNDSYSWVAFPECEETMLAALRPALRA